MPEITFLEREQLIWGNKLEIFYKINITSVVTDFAILTGAAFSGDFDETDIDKINNRVGYYWTKTQRLNGVCVVDDVGDIENESPRINNDCIRPVLQNVDNLRTMYGFKTQGVDYKYFYFGEYPQKAVSSLTQQSLEEMYQNESEDLVKTEKTYTIEYGRAFIKPVVLDEYIFKNKKYVRVKANSCYFRESYTLSNGEIYKNDDYVWVEVLPIKWIYDIKSGLAISEKLLLSGIIFHKYEYDGDFQRTVIKQYIDRFFSNDIIPSFKGCQEEIIDDLNNEVNAYNFDFCEVSEEEIIKGCVEANIAVMLHGRSGDGKSARVKELDTDAEILYLINASPDSLGGKSVLINEEMKDIPPTWYTKLVDKCEREPDKIHIVFFDEITNAPTSIQGMAFNIILDKEVNGKWKLPENARIVAAGNEYSESRSANDMSEPLFNRFAHVYIETKVEDFLKWASTPIETYERLPYKEINLPMKIHPAIYAFIAYRGESVLRTKYTGEEPNADPRKWELSSKVLYSTGKPEMLRSLVGKEITEEFISFCKEKVITLEDVLNGNYCDYDLRMDTSKKYNTAVYLSKVGLEDFEKIREFVKKLGSETCTLFDTLWAKGNIKRLEKIQEIKINEKIGGNVK